MKITEFLELLSEAVDYYMSFGVTWQVTVAIIVMIYIIKFIFFGVYSFCCNLFDKLTATSDLKYDLLIVRLENLHSKVDTLQKTSEGHLEALNELQRRSEELRSHVDIIRTRMTTQHFSTASISTTPVIGGPAPPPPPPPPFSLFTPAVKIVPTSSKTDVPKKKPPTGAPQFSISQADITKVLQKLKKTSSTARLLGSGSSTQRRTPPRRKLFGRSSGHSKRQSTTAFSPGLDRTMNKSSSFSCISPPAHDAPGVRGNGCSAQK